MLNKSQELVAALLEVQELHPGWRFGQTVANVAAMAGVDEPANVWDVTDDELLAVARQHLAIRATETART